MNYSDLLLQCQFGNVRGVKRLLETSKEAVDIFWDENHLLKYAANFDKADVLRAIIEYYEKHDLKLRDPRSDDDDADSEYESWLQSDEYLHAKALLQTAIQDVIDSTDRLSEGVMSVLSQYIMQDDVGSMAGVDEIADEYDCDEETLGVDSVDYSSEELHRRGSDSGDSGYDTTSRPLDIPLVGLTGVFVQLE